MPDRQFRDEPEPSSGELDILNFDHHREERHRWMETILADHERSSGDDRSLRSFSSGSQEFGRQGYGGGHGEVRYGAREWTSTEAWRVPGPFAGRGPRDYHRSDDRIREELNDRLTAHGFIDATDIECGVHNGEVTLAGFIDGRAAKRAAEEVAKGIQGVRTVHNNLRIRSREDAERVETPDAPPLPELP